AVQIVRSVNGYDGDAPAGDTEDRGPAVRLRQRPHRLPAEGSDGQEVLSDHLSNAQGEGDHRTPGGGASTRRSAGQFRGQAVDEVRDQLRVSSPADGARPADHEGKRRQSREGAAVPEMGRAEGQLGEARRQHRENLARRRKEIRKRALELAKPYHLGAFRKG